MATSKIFSSAMVFSPRQYHAAREAVWKGAQRRKSGLDGFKSVYSIFVSRVDVYTEKNFNRVEALDAWARGHGRSLLELAFSWLLAHAPVASVIAGATSAAQIEANVAAANSTLSPADLTEIDSLLASAGTTPV